NNRTALANWGPRKILGALANVKSEQEAAVVLSRIGRLLPDITPEFQIRYYAERFRWAWDGRHGHNREAVKAVTDFLDDIFARDLLSDNPDDRPPMAPDFLAGNWE